MVTVYPDESEDGAPTVIYSYHFGNEDDDVNQWLKENYYLSINKK